METKKSSTIIDRAKMKLMDLVQCTKD